jgi:hypothetical protein
MPEDQLHNRPGCTREIPLSFSTNVNRVRVNALLKKERETAMRTALAQFESEKAQLLQQLEEAKRSTCRTRSPEAPKSGDEDADALKGKLEELKSLLETQKGEVKRWEQEAKQKSNEALTAREEARNVAKRNAMVSAAGKAKFINPDDAVMLTDRFVKWDAESNSFIVIGDHGQARMNSAMEPMTLEEFYLDYAAKNKYMVKGDMNPGFGSTPGNGNVNDGLGQLKLEDLFGKNAKPALTQQLKKQDPAQYAALRKRAVAIGLVA